jgi:hypothetical protein
MIVLPPSFPKHMNWANRIALWMRLHLEGVTLLCAIGLVTLFYTLGIPEVPFHPDESTQLYMSQDWLSQLRNPWDLAWQPGTSITDRVAYRLLDPPFTRLWLGFWLALTQNPPPDHDWDWSKGWEENVRAGALPHPNSLYIGRLSIVMLLPLGLLGIWNVGKAIGGRRYAWIAFALLGSNALVLLHTRRAMAEGPLLAWNIITLWLLSLPKVNPWLVGLTIGLAFNAKYTSLPLLGLVLWILWRRTFATSPFRSWIKSIVIVLVIFMLVSLTLNPVLWKYPLETLKQAIAAREHLLAAQITDFANANPLMVAESIPARIRNLLLQFYFAPPQTSEAANYAEILEVSYQHYLSFPIHNIMRGRIGGGMMLAFTLLGILTLPLRHRRSPPSSATPISILIGGTLLQSAVILGWLPLTFQRYYIPLIPYLVLWAALGLDSLIEIFSQAFNQTWRK